MGSWWTVYIWRYGEERLVCSGLPGVDLLQTGGKLAVLYVLSRVGHNIYHNIVRLPSHLLPSPHWPGNSTTITAQEQNYNTFQAGECENNLHSIQIPFGQIQPIFYTTNSVLCSPLFVKYFQKHITLAGRFTKTTTKPIQP